MRVVRTFLFGGLASALMARSGQLTSSTALSSAAKQETQSCRAFPPPYGCEESCGSGYIECGSFPGCYNPSEGDICCSDGTSCSVGHYCTNVGCCSIENSLSDCGAAVSLSTISPPPSGAPKSSGSTISSTSVTQKTGSTTKTKSSRTRTTKSTSTTASSSTQVTSTTASSTSSTSSVTQSSSQPSSTSPTTTSAPLKSILSSATLAASATSTAAQQTVNAGSRQTLEGGLISYLFGGLSFLLLAFL